jgi:polar amino acid transport system permease protein
MTYLTNWDNMWGLLKSLFKGSGNTLLLFGVTIILAIPLGFLVCKGSTSRFRVLRGVTGVYVLIMRGTPLMLQILFVYFGLSKIFLIPRMIAAILSLTINYAAYFSEIFRGGIQSMEVGQYEAADVLGLTRAQAMRRIILPQMIKRVLPAMGNEIINLVKDTALVSIIAVDDLLKFANSAAMRTSSFVPFVVAAIFYLVMNAVVTKVLRLIEQHFAYYR